MLGEGICGRYVDGVCTFYATTCRSQWPRGQRRGSAAACLLEVGVRISLRAWMCVCCECCLLSGRGLCDELITPPEDRLCVSESDRESSTTTRPWPTGAVATG